MKIVSGRIVVTTMRLERACCRAATSAVAQSPSAMPSFSRQPRVHLDARLRILIDQRTDAARLRAGEKLADDAAGGQDDRILLVDVFGRRRVRRRR